jgi:hypothetical protein
VVGIVLIVVAMVVVLPIGLFLVGALWSALFGWLGSEDADVRAEGQPS